MLKCSLPLSFVFAGDLVRFLLVFKLFVFSFVSKAGEAMVYASERAVFPASFFFAPLMIFPLMAFFMCLDIKGCRSFTKLYVAGKIICIAGSIVWIFRNEWIFKISNVIMMLQSGNQKIFLSMCIVPILIIWDLISLFLVRGAAKTSMEEK